MKIIVKILSSIVVLITFLFLQNNWVKKKYYKVKLNNLDHAFEKYKIVHLSDIHNKRYSKKNGYFVNLIKRENPKIIVITGDLIDRNKYNEKNALDLLRQLVKIAPVYYVPGNHEWWSYRYEDFQRKVRATGTNIFENNKTKIKYKHAYFNLIGIDDLARYCKENTNFNRGYEKVDQALDNILINTKDDDVNILLSHRPEIFDIYNKKNIDLVFCGHAHGGQVRLPIVGGLYSPNQGILPKYDSDIWKENGTQMIVSRGIGNSRFPFRIFNRPEVGIVTLETRY